MRTYRTPAAAMATAAGLALFFLAGCGSSSTTSAHSAGTSSTPAQGSSAAAADPTIKLTAKNWCAVVPTGLSEGAFSPEIGTTISCSGAPNGYGAVWTGKASPNVVVSLQKVTAGDSQMLSNAYYAGQGDPVHTATKYGYTVRDVAYDGIAEADLTLGGGNFLEVTVQANTVQELPSGAAASAAGLALTAVGLLKAGG